MEIIEGVEKSIPEGDKLIGLGINNALINDYALLPLKAKMVDI